MLDVEDAPSEEPVGVVAPGHGRRDRVPAHANEPFIIRYVIGKTRNEEPRDEGNMKLPGAAVEIIGGGSIRCVRRRCGVRSQRIRQYGLRGCILGRRGGDVREKEGRGKRSEYLLQRLRPGP